MSAPFASHSEEARAIEATLAGDLAKKLRTCDPIRHALFISDGLKMAAELRLLTSPHRYSHAPHHRLRHPQA
jgi:hypothetical protein